MASLSARLVASLAAALLACGTAQAAVLSATGAVGGAQQGTVRETFDSLTPGSQASTLLPSGISISFGGDAQPVQGAASGLYAAPYVSGLNGNGFGNPPGGPDATTYLTTGSTGTSAASAITLQLPYMATYFGVLWGSVDGYNSLSFYSGNTLVGTLTGSDVQNGPNGDQGVAGTLYVNITSAIGFDRVVATSSSYAFEFDNVAFISAVPEPLSMALLGSGLLGLGLARARRRAG